eukprot:15180372-Heterocapsa_arctica.AAC.1
MSWGGQGSGWQCNQCGYSNHHSSRVCVDCQGYGQYPDWGKGKKGKGDYPPYREGWIIYLGGSRAQFRTRKK